MPRPSLLSHEIVGGVRTHLLNGATMADCAAALGISEAVLYKWRARGADARQRAIDTGETEPAEALYVEFVETLDESRALAKLEAIAVWRRAMVGWDEVERTTTTRTEADGTTITTSVERTVKRFDWRAAQTWLERRYVEEYGRRMLREGDAADDFGAEPETVEQLRARGIAVLDLAAKRRAASGGPSGNGAAGNGQG